MTHSQIADDELADMIMDGIAMHGEGLLRSQMQERLGLTTLQMARGMAQGIARGSFDLTSTMRLVWDE